MNTIELLGEEETFRNIVERKITEFEDNKIDVIGDYAFYKCNTLTNVSFPNVTSIGDGAFQSCSNLRTIYVGTNTSTVCTLSSTKAFNSCTNLTNIYVPANLVDNYKSATNWSSYASKIKAYEQPVG